MRGIGILVVLSFASPAGAVPMMLTQQGRLLDAGQPLGGTHSLSFSIYDEQNAGAEVWSEQHDEVTFDSGYYSVVLGIVEDLDPALFGSDASCPHRRGRGHQDRRCSGRLVGRLAARLHHL